MRDSARRRGRRLALGLAAVAVLGSACATRRIVPLPAPNVTVDAAQGTTTAIAGGVELSVRPAAWRGSPWDLPSFVTPFLVRLVNGASAPLAYDYPGFRLFDEGRFQYTAIPPVEVERIIRAHGAAAGRRLADADPLPPVPLHRRALRDPFWDWWWWERYYDPWYYAPPRLDDVYLMALPMGPLQPGARVEGFVYFPRLRATATRLTFEFHHRVGPEARVLWMPFGIEQSGGGMPASS